MPGERVELTPVEVVKSTRSGPCDRTCGSSRWSLAALNLTVTYLAFRQPRACGFNRSTGIMASLPALLAGSACCAPTIALILGLQLSSLFITVFQVLIPVSVLLLVVTLVLILGRTEPTQADHATSW